MRYEVRCCCQPEKLLGWVDAPEGASHVRLVELSPAPRFAVGDHRDPAPVPNPPAIELPIATMYHALDNFPTRAVKAEGWTKEELKKFCGFVPNEKGA